MQQTESKNYRVAPPADWIKISQYSAADVARYASSPYFYPLVDYQELVADGEFQSYCRTLQKINDSSRIEDASLFLIDLHEDNQTLVIHGLEIIRDGEVVSTLNPDSIKTYHRQKSLEDHITDNLLTVSISIDDLRVGDLIDFHSTTLERAGEHPLWGRYCYNTFWLDWACPVVTQQIRIVNQSAQDLSLHHHFLDEGKQSDSTETLAPDSEFARAYTDLTPKSINNTAPNWLWTDFLQVTSSAGWPQVSAAMHRYYSEAGALGETLDARAIKRIELGPEREENALRIIRFVQNEIRYRGENHGVYTHTPKAPHYALEKGAGDCKDKSNLVVALLKSIDVDANLVLVNTQRGKGIHRLQPSAYHFNHMIARVCIDDQAYYFDPTIQKQAGDLTHAAQLNYGYALNLTAAGEDLSELPFDFSRKVFALKHYFDFRDPQSGDGSMRIERRFQTHRADNMRYYFDANETDKIQQDYLQWSKSDTGLELSPLNPITVVEDDIKNNILTTREEYQISNLDKTHPESQIQITTDFFRDFPLPADQNFPVQIMADGAMEHALEIGYRRKPDINPSDEGISNLHFSYLDRVWCEGKVLKFNTEVTPYREVVDQRNLDEYQSDVETMAGRSVNCFPCKMGFENSLGWNMIIVAMMLAAGILALLGNY